MCKDYIIMFACHLLFLTKCCRNSARFYYTLLPFLCLWVRNTPLQFTLSCERLLSCSVFIIMKSSNTQPFKNEKWYIFQLQFLVTSRSNKKSQNMLQTLHTLACKRSVYSLVQNDEPQSDKLQVHMSGIQVIILEIPVGDRDSPLHLLPSCGTESLE